MVFGLFKSKEEKQKEIERRAQEELDKERKNKEFFSRIDQERRYEEILSKVIITPESQDQYERRVGYEVEQIDTGDKNKGVIFSNAINRTSFTLHDSLKLECLAKGGIEALIQANLTKYGYTSYYYGLPVAKKKGGTYR